MKKNYLLVGLLALGMLAFQSCKENETPGGGTIDPDLDGKMEELAPSAQKTRLQDAGLDFVAAIDAADHENLADLLVFFDEEYAEYDIDEDYVDKLDELLERTGDDEYDVVNPEVWGANAVWAIRRMAGISLDMAKSGAQLASRAEDVYTTTLMAGLKDIYGGFTPNEYDEVWEYDETITDRLEVKFTDDHNQKWVATLKGSKETTSIRVKGIEKNIRTENYTGGPDNGSVSTEKETYEGEYVIEVPKQISFTVTCNQATVVELSLTSSLAIDVDVDIESKSIQNYEWYEYSWSDEGGYYYYEDGDWDEKFSFEIDYTNLNMGAKLIVNNYEENFETTVTKSAISAGMGVKIDGKSMLNVEAALSADMDAIIKQGNEAGEDLDDVELDPSVLKGFSLFVDVMGQVQIYGKCDRFEDIYDIVLNIDEAIDEDDFKNFERNVELLNKTFSITIHYDNTETVQARIEFEAYEKEDEWSEDVYFDVRPILIFAVDDSRYSFEDYFTERSFSDLIEALEELVEEFEDLYGDYFEEDNAIVPDYGEY